MKHCLPLLCFLAALLGLAGCDDSPKSDSPAHAANEFFLEIGEAHFQKAYDNTAFAFQAQTTFKNFQTTVRELGLTAGTLACNWTKEEVKDREVKLTGEVTAANGTAVPVVLTVIKERGSWHIFSLRTPGESGNVDEDRFSLVGKGGTFNQLASREAPPKKILNQLVLENLLLFNNAIQQGKYDEFYSKVSLAWQTKLTMAQLKRDFQPFVDAKINISGIREHEPIFDAPPEVTPEGILLLKGHYDTPPYRVFFVIRFSYELPYWKLFGVEVQIHG